MKKVINGIVSAVCAVVLVLGCAGNGGSISEKPRYNTSLDLPDFILKPTSTKPQKGETFIYGAGQCAVYENEADADLAITTADKLARQKILDLVSNKMASHFDHYANVMGNTNPQIKRATQNALSTFGKMDLPGVEIIEREYRKGVISSRARWSKKATNVKAVIERAKAIVRQENALSSMDTANEMWEKMRKGIEDIQ